MFKTKSDKNNQLKLNEIIIFINRVLLTILQLRNQRLIVFKKCKDKFLLLIIAGMNTFKLNLNFNCSTPIYLVEFIYIYIYYYLHKLINVLENNKLGFE